MKSSFKKWFGKFFAFSILSLSLMTGYAWAVPLSDGGGVCTVSSPDIAIGEITTGTTAFFEFNYVVPVSGIAVAGGIRITIPQEWTTPQISSSNAYGYVSATTTKAGVSLNVAVDPASSTITITTLAGLDSGDSIFVVYGDTVASTSYGSKTQDIAQQKVTFFVESNIDGDTTFAPIVAGSPFVDVIPAGTYGVVTGTVTYTGSESGKIYVLAFSSWPAEGNPIPYTIARDVLDSTGTFRLFVTTSTTRYFAAIVDADGNGTYTDGESTGEANPDGDGNAQAIPVDAGGRGDVLIAIQDEISISGNISYGGAKTGTYVVVLSTQSDFSSWLESSTSAAAGPYTLQDINIGTTYYVKSWIDEGSLNWWHESHEAYGIWGGTVTPQVIYATGTVENINITLSDPVVTDHINGNINYSGSTSGVFNVIVEFWDNPDFSSGFPVSSATFVAKTIPDDLPLAYASTGLLLNTSYYIRSWIDVTSNFTFDSTEPFYASSHVYVGNISVNHGINLQDPAPVTTGSITGSVYYTEGKPGNIEIRVNHGEEWFAVSYSSTIPALSEKTTYQFTVDGVEANRSYHVFAFKLAQDTTTGNFEQVAEYEYNPVYVTTSTPFDVGGLELHDIGGLVTGKISFDRPIAGRVFVLAMNTADIADPFDRRMEFYPDGSSNQIEYRFTGLPTGNTYYIGAYLDTNWNFGHDPQEPKGFYDANGDEAADTIVTSTQAVGGIDITLTEPQGDGQIVGTVYYSGTSTGAVRLQYWYNYDMNQSTTGAVNAAVAVSTAQAYSISDLLPGQYNIRAFIDTNDNGAYDAGEAAAVHRWIWFPGGMMGLDFTIQDPSEIEIRGEVVYSSATSVAVDDAIVKLFDTQGNWDPSDDVLIASAASTGVLISSGPNQYNFVLSSFTIVPGRDYRLKANKSGMSMEPAWDIWLQVNDISQSIQYMSNISWTNGFKASQRPVYTVSSLEVSNGVETSTQQVTITPNNDGNRENAEIEFVYNVPYEVDNFNGAMYRMIIDTNKDGNFSWFDWSSVRYDANGDPIYQGTTRTWDELNRIIAEQSDWTRDGWIVNTGTSTERVIWEGRTPNWTSVGKGTYSVALIMIDNSWWDESSYEDYIVYEDSTSLSVIVDVIGISGNVHYAVGSSTSAVSGARVNAGGERGWGQAYTDRDGNYEITGLSEGRYWINIEARGFSATNREVIMGSTGTSGVDFSLEKGGIIRGKVKLSEVFTPYYDQWGNYSNQLSGNINAWSETSPNHGWTQFTIYSGTDTSEEFDIMLPPGEYRIQAQAPGYASIVSSAVLTGTTTVTRNFTLQKAASINGVLQLPEAATKNLWMNIGAKSTDNVVFAWGGGQILQGQTTGAFTIRDIFPGKTYNLRFNVEGYADKVMQVTVASTDTDKNIGTVAVTSGGVIFGTMTIAGNTSSVQVDSWIGKARLWINAYGRSIGFGRGAEVQFSTSATQIDIPYRIGGLEQGTYDVNTWLDGFELDDMPGNSS